MAYMQFSSSRAPAAGLPYAATNRHRQNTGQVKSLGPMEKCTPQSHVAGTINNKLPECGRQNGVVDVDIVAPNSDDPLVNFIARSDILWASRLDSAPRRATGGFPAMNCFAALNGIPIDYPVKFAGVGTNPGQARGMDMTKPTDAACALGGTETIVNLGDRTIYVMDIVWASEFPYIIVDQQDGCKMPGVDEIGHSKQQYRGATYSMGYANTITIMRMLQSSVKALFRDGVLGKNWDTEMTNEIEKTLVRKAMPMWFYAFLYLGFLMFLDFVNLNYTDGQLNDVIPTILKMYWTYKRNMKNKFDLALDVGLDNTSEIDHCETSMSCPTLDRTNQASVAKWHRVVGHELRMAMEECQALQHDWINARCIGTAMNTAKPGENLDVYIRAYHN